MGRGEQVLEVMKQEPERTWTSAEMSLRLSCAPVQANETMKRLVSKSLLIRVGPGEYCHPSRFARPATSTPVDSPPPAALVTASERELLLKTLRSFGYPVHGSSLAARLRREVKDFDLSHLGPVAAELRQLGQIVRHPDGKYALPHWERR